MAFNPATGLVYIPTMEAPMIFLNLSPKGFKYDPDRMNVGGVGVLPELDNPEKKGRFAGRPVPPVAGLLKDQPDPTMHSFLRAGDPVRQAVAWETETSGPWQGQFPAIWNGGGPVPKRAPLVHDRTIPRPPELATTATPKGNGALLFAMNCARCHRHTGPGVIPDLRYMSAAIHEEFNAIVLEETRAERGMAAFGDILTSEQADAIHAYLLGLARRAYEKQQADNDLAARPQQ